MQHECVFSMIFYFSPYSVRIEGIVELNDNNVANKKWWQTLSIVDIL